MTFLLDVPARVPSLLTRLDPRWKLGALVPAAVAAALLRTPAAAATALVCALALAALARLPLRWFALRLAVALAMLALFVVWLPLIPLPHHEIWEWDGWRISVTGARLMVVLLAKTACLVSLLLVLFATAPLQDTFKACRCFHVPGALIHLLLLTYRYVFVVGEEFTRVRTALRVRGYRNRANVHSYRTIGQVAGTLLVRSHERSERVAQAMRCRGFDGHFRSLHEFRTTSADVGMLVAVYLVTAGLVAWDVASR
jgi:cobalt/nickel transport system permease protein